MKSTKSFSIIYPYNIQRTGIADDIPTDITHDWLLYTCILVSLFPIFKFLHTTTINLYKTHE